MCARKRKPYRQTSQTASECDSAHFPSCGCEFRLSGGWRLAGFVFRGTGVVISPIWRRASSSDIVLSRDGSDEIVTLLCCHQKSLFLRLSAPHSFTFPAVSHGRR